MPYTLIRQLFLTPSGVLSIDGLLRRFLRHFVQRQMRLLSARGNSVILVILAALFRRIMVGLAEARRCTLRTLQVGLISFASN